MEQFQHIVPHETMSKTRIPAIIVVEGASDKALLESFLDAEIIITNGSDVPYETLLFLKKASQEKDIIVLTDPDFPGKKIRDKLDSAIPGLHHAFIPKEKAIKKHKVGVAESDKETILEALNSVKLADSDSKESDITYMDLIELELVGAASSSIKREKLGKRLNVGYGNGKTLLKRLKILGISKEELKEAMKA